MGLMVSEKKIFQVFPIITLWELSVAMETRLLIRSDPKPNTAFPPSSGAGSVENCAHPDTSNTLCRTAYGYELFAKCMLANQKMPYFQDGGTHQENMSV